MAIFSLVAWLDSTAPRPTSLPVPAVVGMAMRGSASVMARPFRSAMPEQPMATAAAVLLAQSMAEPPPRATMAFAPASRAIFAQASTFSQVGLGSTSEAMARILPWAYPMTLSARPIFLLKGSATSTAWEMPCRAMSSPRDSSWPAPNIVLTGFV